MNDAITTNQPVRDDGYEAPELSDFGSIEQWTKGSFAEAVNISLVIV